MTAVHKDDVVILGFAAQALKQLDLHQGFNPLHFADLAKALQPYLIEDRRGNFENDIDRRHFIPYLLVCGRKLESAEALVFAYQRGKGVGESRLAGNDSIGLGGHVDKPDFKYGADDLIDLAATIYGSAARELREEITGFDEAGFHLNFHGVIVDDSDEVGKVHLGLVMSVVLPQGVPLDPFVCKEEELITHGFRTVDQLAGLKLESWSNILLNQFLVGTADA